MIWIFVIVLCLGFMTAPNLTQGANLTLTLDGKKYTYWTIAQKAFTAPSIVEIDKQPQLKPRN